MNKLLLSVVIPTYRRRAVLEQVILAAENQTGIERGQYEVIVCGSSPQPGSDDGTGEMMAGLTRQFPNLRYIELDVNSAALKRNTGMCEARAEVVVIFDDDAVPAPDCLASHLAAHQGRSHQYLCGQVRFPEAWVARSNYFRFRDSRYLGPDRLDIDPENIPYHLIVSMNGSFRRAEILERVGLMSEEFDCYGGEDYEWGYRMARAGIVMRYRPEAMIEHREPGSSLALFMKKLYVTSRDSLPVLYRLAPGSREGALTRLIETPRPEDPAGLRVAQSLMRLALHPSLVDLVAKWLEKTDGWRWCYSSVLFRYVSAGAMLRGIREREPGASQAHGPLTSRTGDRSLGV